MASLSEIAWPSRSGVSTKNSLSFLVCASAGGHLGARQLLSSNVLGRKTPQVGSKQIFTRELGPASRIWVHNFGCVPPVIEDEMPLEVIRGPPG